MTRICPVCAEPLSPRAQNHVVVDVCVNCRGIWLDEGEFDALIAGRYLGRGYEELFDQSVSLALEARPCPGGHGAMQLVEFGPIELDRCPTCFGIWVDGDETRKFAEVEPDQLLSGSDSEVQCGACGDWSEVGRTLRRLDLHFCERCVAEGNYPGGPGPSAQHYIASSARLMAEAHVDQKSKKDMQARGKRAKSALAGPTGRGYRAPSQFESELFVRFTDFLGGIGGRLITRKEDRQE